MPDETNQPEIRSVNAISRREVMMLSAAACLAAGSWPLEAAEMAAVKERAVDIKTPDGTCDAVLLSPASGRSPAVILYPDAFGLRPVKIAMGRRLAAQGYAVLVINPYYRARRAPVFPPSFDYTNPTDRAEMTALRAVLDHDAVTRDAHALVAFLDAQPEVNRKAKLGAFGFCAGGSMTIRAAAAEPKRLGACVSFHGGQLVTDDVHSPHRLIPATRAAYHIAIAASDDAKEPQSKTVLADTLKTAKLAGTVEVYPDTKHGWMVPDSAIYDQAQAERGWVAITRLYQQALGGRAPII
jgi:carboxymethylenebutenolidase